MRSIIRLVLLAWVYVARGLKIPIIKNIRSRSILRRSTIISAVATSTDSTGSNEVRADGDGILTALEAYKLQIENLRGTPELVDKLEYMVSNYPGIEVDIDLYRSLYPFKLDNFQEQGIKELIDGKNVIVTTPTGSGKTLVGELAIYFALMMGLRVMYTTPLKALSNQKFSDFKEKFGGDRVGLLTGDIAINRGAAVTVMTTEVFRNMIYDPDSSNQLSDVFVVIFDEFHYMNDPDRGTVWEECIISCPPHIRILALSATMGNVDDIQGWFQWIHGPTALIASNFRPVPLKYLFALKSGLMPLFRDPNAGPGSLNGIKKIRGVLEPSSVLNPSITKVEEQALKKSMTRATTSQPFRNPKPNPQALVPKYSDVAEDLHNLKLLPAIVFIFSRAGCEQSAKMVAQTKSKLLNEDEVLYITRAIALFAKNNPEIPIQKSVVVMLKAGVAVHHAGLIPVWKAFIEDLFNANKIKVLFATETLAAGVNMPARTTVIASVTKKINSEVVKLKTSQLLQMAGRAGRRGKDIEGTVVLVRSRYEDAKVGHKILTSNIDGIKSHFKTSYGLTVRLLETKSLDECKALIERGFGSYLLQKKLKAKGSDTPNLIDEYKRILQKYTLQGARDYFKLKRRLKKELRSEEFQLERLNEADLDLVQVFADYMPMGIGIHLKNGESGFFLGDIKWGNNNANGGYGVITNSGDSVLIVGKQHIKAVSDTDDSIPISSAQELLNIVEEVSAWDEEKIVGCKRVMLRGIYDMDKVKANQKILDALQKVLSKKLVLNIKEPGSLLKQKMIIKELQDELHATEIDKDNAGDAILDALKYAVAQKDPVGFVSSSVKSWSETSETFAWKMFQSVVTILQEYGALNGTTSTNLGQLVGSLSADNELWLAIVLQLPSVSRLTAPALAAVMCGLVTDGFKASNAFFRQRPSDPVEDVFNELEKLSLELNMVQGEAGIDFPVNLCRESGGLIEQWAAGANWRDLCKDTSLDQGDVCRMLRRTVEVLRQIPMAYGIDPAVAQTAHISANMIDRFPIADFDPNVDSSSRGGIGYGVTGDSKEFEEDESMYEDDEKVSERSMNDTDLLFRTMKDTITPEVIAEVVNMSDSSLDELLKELDNISSLSLHTGVIVMYQFYYKCISYRLKLNTHHQHHFALILKVTGESMEEYSCSSVVQNRPSRVSKPR